MRLQALGLAFVLAAGCNLVTGADGVEIADDDGDEQSAGVTGASSSGTGGATSTGTGATSATGTTTGAGGAVASSGAGATSSSSTASGASTASASSGSTTSAGSTSGTSTGAGGASCGGSGPGTTPLDTEEQIFVTLINNHRSLNNLGAVAPCISLSRAAQGHSEDMRDQDYFDHTNPAGEDPFDRMCTACFELSCASQTAMAENIAAGNSTAQATFDQWRNSPGHNTNMLSPSFNFIGIGRATGGGTYGSYWTNVFAGNDEASCY